MQGAREAASLRPGCRAMRTMDDFDQLRAEADQLSGISRQQSPLHHHHHRALCPSSSLPCSPQMHCNTRTSSPGQLSPAHMPADQEVFCSSSPVFHHARSLSCRSRAARRPRDLELRSTRRRTYSMPTKNRFRKPASETSDSAPSSRHSSQADDDDDLVRVRTFSTSSRGIINRGDSFKRRLAAESAVGVVAEPDDGEDVRERTWSNTSEGSSSTASSVGCCPAIHRVAVMGARQVGKTSIIQQFMTSEYMGNNDCSQDEEDEDEPRSVSVLLDDQESTMQFVDHSPPEDDPDHIPNADAYLIVYSVSDYESFDDAVDLLHELRKKELLLQTAVILVANKSDLVRMRQVEEQDGKTMATRYDVKYIEVSAVLNHKVDDLLAGILHQIRLKERRKTRRSGRRRAQDARMQIFHNGGSGCLPSSRSIVGRILGKSPMFRSCDNLMVS